MEPSNQDQNHDVFDVRSLESIDYKDPSLWEKLIQSNDPKDKKLLNLIAMKIIDVNDNGLFASLLAHDYKIDVLNEKGQTALHYAFCKGRSQIVQRILNWKPFQSHSSNYTDSNGLTHLHIACTEYHALDLNTLEIIKRYLKDGSDINACYHSDPENRYSQFTPLHFAVSNRKPDVVKLLLENGASVNAVTSKGKTPLQLASQLISSKNVPQIIEVMVTFHSDIERRDERGNTPLLNIFDNDECMEITFSIKDAKNKFDAFLKNGADIRAKNNKGDTVLHLIINTLKFSHCHLYMPQMSFNDTKEAELVKEILKSNGELLEVKNNEGKTPLQLAISMASADVVKVLLDHEADISLIKFNCGNERIFCYPEIVPHFDIVHNITTIIRLISDRGFVLSLEDNLVILKFLVHEVDCCECSSSDCDENIVWQTIIAMEYGTPIHTIQVLNKLRENDRIEPVLYFLQDFQNLMKDANFYLDKEMKENIVQFTHSYYNDYSDSNLESRKQELEHLKLNVKLKNGVKLYDLMLKHPHAASRFFTDDCFDPKLFNDFVRYKNIIEGFMTKVIVRNYIVKSAYDFLPLTPLSSLPALCNEIIFDFLSNVDIFNLCATALFPESKNIVIN